MCIFAWEESSRIESKDFGNFGNCGGGGGGIVEIKGKEPSGFLLLL